MLKNIILFSSFFCFAKIDFNVLEISDVESVDICENKIVASNVNGLFLFESNPNSNKKTFSFDKKKLIAPKVALDVDRVFVNTENSEFCCYDFDGNIVFKKNTKIPCLSDIVLDNNSVVFSLADQTIVSYSKQGDLLWVNNSFQSNDGNSFSKIENNSYLFFLNKFVFAFLDKKTGTVIFKTNQTTKASNFYFDKVIRKVFVFDYSSVFSFDLKNPKTIQEKESFFDSFYSKGIEYSYKNGMLINKKTNQSYEVNLKNIKFFEGKIFIISKFDLTIIDGDSVIKEKLGFVIKDVFYKNGILVVTSSEKLRWTKL